MQYGARRNFFEGVVNGIRALPGVDSAAISEEGTPPWNGVQTRMTLDNLLSRNLPGFAAAHNRGAFVGLLAAAGHAHSLWLII
jgi:hypothetical protein